MAARVNTLCFLLGIVISMAALSLLGSTLVPKHLVDNFVRFHARLGPEYNFFATARDVKAIVDKAAEDREAVIVLIGGSSVFQGTAQKDPQIWTQLLQSDLGNRFHVVNLALRAGAPTDFAETAAEILLKENRPFIFLCDAASGRFANPLSSTFYRSTIFDAWQRGYLLPWPDRDRDMTNAFWSPDGKVREAAWGSVLNKYLNFNDLWGDVAYEYGGTIWNKGLGFESFEPFRMAQDPELPPEVYRERGYPTGSSDQLEMNITRSYSKPLDAAAVRGIGIHLDQMVPPAVRSHTIAVVLLNSPFYRSRLTADEQQSSIDQAAVMANILKDNGLHDARVMPTDFDSADYNDRVHLSSLGGKKLADWIAPEIERMAIEAGYLK